MLSHKSNGPLSMGEARGWGELWHTEWCNGWVGMNSKFDFGWFMVFVSTFSHIKWTKAILIRTDNLLSSIPHPLLYQSIRLGYCTQIVAVVVVAAFFFNNSNQFQGNGFFFHRGEVISFESWYRMHTQFCSQNRSTLAINLQVELN